MPCRDYLSQLREAYPKIEGMGAGALAVATGAAYQAQRLMDDGVPFPCLVDPERRLYRARGIDHIARAQYLRPDTWRRYFRSLRRARPGRITGDARQAPGVVVLAPDRTVRYLHRGVTLGDYPPLPEVVKAARSATGG
jgi:hypothetical protein